MNYNDACTILELKPYNYSNKELKHNYYLKALKYHPDKNSESNAKILFQEVLNAYDFLNKFENLDETLDETLDGNSYLNILEKFLTGILNKNIDASKFLSILNNKYSEISIELLNHFSKNTLIKLHKFVIQYSDILHINKDIVERIEILIKNYTKNDNVTIITPTLENLINDEIYKLELNNDIYYIPTWHNELIYDISNNSNEFVVQCEPNLPEYITLDEYNNLYVNLSTSIKNILDDTNITINIGTRQYIIPINELYIKKYQRYTFYNTGVSLIDTKDIYNVVNRGNIYVDICFTDVGK